MDATAWMKKSRADVRQTSVCRRLITGIPSHDRLKFVGHFPRSDAMKTRPHKIQLAALTLAIASMAPAIFPNIQPGVEPIVMQGGCDYSEEHTGAVAASAVYEALRRMPLSFEINRGQAHGDVKFVGRGDGFGLLLKPN